MKITFFQPSFFYEEAQLISIYYVARFLNNIDHKISQKAFDFEEMKTGKMSFRWKKINELKIDDVTFPIDKEVVKMLQKIYE